MRTARLSLSLVVLLLASPFRLTPAAESFVAEGIRAEIDVRVSMRDGVELSTNVYRPESGGPFPVVLMRSPYGNFDKDTKPVKQYVEHGYAAVAQDCRGRFESQGVWDPFLSESADGHDTILWVAAQPWCNGAIGMVGGSYVGFTQWLAAIDAPPSLRCIVPLVSPADFYGDCAYTGGAFDLMLVGVWGGMMAAPQLPAALQVNWPEA
jgi:uncharacterized protein